MKQSSGDKTCTCKESPKNKIDTTQICNTTTHMDKKSCSCNESSKHKSETPGYIYEVPKYDSKLEKNPCACNSAIKEHSEPHGYMDMSKYKPKNVVGTQASVIGSMPHKCHKDSCSCKESEYTLRGPGFIYDVPKHSDGPASGRSCHCSESAKISPETHGYVYEVPKQVKQKTCSCKGSSTTREQSNSTQIYSINRLETRFIVSDIHHNIKKKSSNCTESSKLKPELTTHTFEVPKYSSKSKKKNCQCSPICKRKSFSHEYINEVSKYKPTKTAQEIFKNILGTQADAIGLLPNKCRKNNCRKSDNELKGPGFVYNVPKYPRMPISQQSYKCSESAKTESESHGYIYMKQPSGDNKRRCACSGSPENKFRSSGYNEYQKYNMTPREQSNTTQIYSVNKLETQYTDTKRNTNTDCECSKSDKRNSELSGYVYEVPKNDNSESENNNSHCKRNKNEPDDNAVATLGNIYYQKDSCVCEKSEYKLEGPGFVYDIAKYPDAPTTRKGSDYTDSAKNKSESPGNVNEVPQSTKTIPQDKSPYQKNICACKEPAKSKPDSLAYEFTYLKSKLCSEDVLKLINKQKHTIESLSNQYNNSTNDGLSSKNKSLSSCNDSCGYKSNNNAQEIFKDILEIHKNAIETLHHKYHKKNSDCNACKKNELESYGFVYEVPKLPHNSISQKKSCECVDSSKRKSDPPGYIVDVSKPEPIKQKESSEGSDKDKFEATKSAESKITSTPSESQNNCKQMPCTQSDNTETVKSIKLPPENKELPKDKLELNNCVSQNVPSSVPPIQTHNDAPQSNTGKEMLSAQVMDVPYSEFNASVACDKSDTSKKLKKLSKYDIFKRIKEAYKACSCKVCECIAGKTVKPDICKCKPCECADCLSYLEKSYFKPSSSNRSSFESSKCPCDGCDKSQCPSAMNKLEMCDCSPCSCVKCARSYTKFCDCEPCECVDCKTKKLSLRQTLVVAPVGREQNVQRIACTCSPCDCIECGIVHRLASNVMHEMSTGTNRHALCRCEICLDEACDQSGVDSCKCQKRNKVMNKPVEKDTHDFDIRLATIVQKPITQWNNRKGEKHDTIAMFAAVPNTYPDSQSNTQACTCKEECECISCICKEHAINSIKSSQFFTSIETRPKYDLNTYNEAKSSTTENLRFSSYQCQVCKSQVEDRSSFDVLMPAMSKCVCDYCDSKDCRKNGSKSPQRLLNISYNHMDYEQSMLKNNAKVLHENNLQNNEVSESVFSGYSSIETTSKTSCHKEYGMITQNSRNKNKSWESSCNSSGHDYPEYLIQFPKSTVEHCLKDVMELDIDKNLKLNKLNINSNVTEEQIDLMSCDTTLAKENCLPECGMIDSYNPEYITRHINNHDVSQPDYRSCCFPDVSQHTLHTSAKCSNTLDPNRHLVLQVNNRQYSHKPKKSECQESNFMETKQINELQVSGYIPDRKSPVNINDENRTIFNPMHNENEFHTSHKVFDYNVGEENKTDTLLPIDNDNDCTGKYLKQLPQTCLVNVAHGLSLDDYDRIRNTLKEAKEFTRELVKLLKIYEKANNDFESVSEKLKISYASLISGDKNAKCGVKEEVVDECIVKEERYSEINHELQEHLQAPSVRETSSSITHVKRNISDKVEYNDHDNDKMSQKTILKDISNFQKVNESIIAVDPSHDFNSVLETNELEQIETHLNKDEVCCESAVNEKMIEEHLGLVRNVQKTGINPLEKCKFHALEENTSAVNSRGIKKKDRKTHVTNYKKYSKLLKHVLLISRKICVINSNAIGFKPITKCHVTVGTSTTVVSESIKKTNHETSTFLPIKFAVEDSHELLTLRRQGNELNQILKRLGTVFRNFEEDAESLGKTCVLERGFEEYNMKDTSNLHELEETDTWSILKKNSSWNFKPRKNSRDLCIIPSMELDLKKMVHSISQQKVVYKKRLNVPHHKNRDLEPIRYATGCAKVDFIEEHKNKLNLEIEEASMPGISLQSFGSSNQYKNVEQEVCCSDTNMDKALESRDLLNVSVEMMPLKNKRALEDNTSTATLVSSLTSDKNNCDTLKVGFTALRRVSDDTVFVKWNVPRDLYKVKGYEELEETDTWSILKKNSSWNFKPRKNSRDLCIIPSMELDLKKMVHSISQQKVVYKKRLNVPHHKNRDLEPIRYATGCAKVDFIEEHKNKLNLEIEEASMPGISLQSFGSSNQYKNVEQEVCCSDTNMDKALESRDLLNVSVEMMPLKNKRALEDNTSTATLVSSLTSDKNNCDTLKVGFTALRRVSDDTVFVKWNVPRDLYKVKGYELLVDGRSVKTILTPTKSMAVVTCLPPADRVLLTIRTITSDVSVTGHYPATTIIYNPRVK
uniref:Uncharacterized protein n=1 Tax=Heliothis virescens TaxID=7102 RepID=A0A2A4JPA7_HELVI